MNNLNFFYKKNFLNIIFFLLIFLLFTHYIYQANKFSYLNNGWLIGDWLINYEGGFVRRGLSGEFFLLLNNLFDVDLNRLVFYFQLVISLIFFVLCFLYIINIKLDIFLVCLLFSPTIFMFSFYDAFMVGRKEMLIYIVFLSFIFIIINDIRKTGAIYSYIVISSVFLPLISEIIIFYLPYFFLLTVINKNKENNKYFTRIFLIQLIITVISIFFIFIFGSQINTDEICKIILERKGEISLCSGAILDSRQNFLEIISWNFNRYVNYDYFIHYFSSIFVTVLLFNIYLYLSNLKNNYLIKFNVYSSFLFIFSTPLFVLGTDWGRWINIHFILLIFLLIFSKIRNYKGINEHIILPTKKNYLILIVFFTLSFGWNSWNCCPNQLSSHNFYFGKGIYERIDTIIFKILN